MPEAYLSLTCTVCSRSQQHAANLQAFLLEQIRRDTGFEPEIVTIAARGTCPRCAQTSTPPSPQEP